MQYESLASGGDIRSSHSVTVSKLFQPLIPRFLANRKQEILAIAEAWNCKDFSTIEKLSHGMKGASGSYGFLGLMEIASAMESAAKNHQADNIESLIHKLRQYFDSLEVVYE